MNIRTIVVLLATVGWFGFSWWYYSCKIKGFCGENSSQVAITENAKEESEQKLDASPSFPLAFKWGEATPLPGADFEKWKSGMISDSTAGKMLMITGKYFDAEQNNELGKLRAQQIKRLFADLIDTNRIYISSEALPNLRGQNEDLFEGASFAWFVPEKSIVERFGNKILVYFPYKSNQKIDDPEVDKLLDELATEIKDSNHRIELIGHTDDIGSKAYNMGLGNQRAIAIQQLLVSQGLNIQRISVQSKGESAPIGDNTTDAGQKKNRRVEINIHE